MAQRLIITTNGSGAGSIGAAGLADIVISLERRLVWGPLPSEQQLDAYFDARATQEDELYWQVHTPAWRFDESGGKNLGLVEFCAGYDSTELWIDPDPNAQLNLIWLLDFLRTFEAFAGKMKLAQANVGFGELTPGELKRWHPPRVDLTKGHLELAGVAWRSFRDRTPENWFGLLSKDLSLLPQLQPAALALLNQLPSHTTGLSDSETWMLEFISSHPGATANDAFRQLHQNPGRRVFDYWEIGPLLDGLARCPAPAISGLEEGPFTSALVDDRERRGRYFESKLSLTPLGQAVLAGTEDFARHNPIHRWWGGTELTNDRLWRWDANTKALLAP